MEVTAGSCTVARSGPFSVRLMDAVTARVGLPLRESPTTTSWIAPDGATKVWARVSLPTLSPNGLWPLACSAMISALRAPGVPMNSVAVTTWGVPAAPGALMVTLAACSPSVSPSSEAASERIAVWPASRVPVGGTTASHWPSAAADQDTGKAPVLIKATARGGGSSPPDSAWNETAVGETRMDGAGWS